MFFAKGPFADLSFSGSPEEGCVSFPGLNIPKGKTVFIMPRMDNLVLWHFSVVDRDERPIATFAFDEKTEQSFSPYDYVAEEARKFLFYNPLFNEKDNPILDLLHKFVIDYQRETVFKQGKKIFFPRLYLPIRGDRKSVV